MSMAPPATGTSEIQTTVSEPAFLQRWGLLLVTALALVVAVVTFDPRLDPEIDSAQFIDLAKALRAGLGMRYIYLPDAPTPDKFPIGFPLLLAGVEWAAPDSLIARKALVAACYVGSMALVFRLALTYVPPLMAVLVTVLVTVNPFVVGMARLVMSEIPYLFVSLVALCLLERALERQGPSARWAWVGGVTALLAAAQIRTIGWSLLVALLVVLLRRRRYRTLVGVLAGIALPVGLLMLVGVRPIGSRYVEIWEHQITTPRLGDSPAGATGALTRIGTSAFQYGWHVIPTSLVPIPLQPIRLTAHRTLLPALPGGAGSAWSSLMQALVTSLCLLALALGAWPSLREQRLTPHYPAVFMGILVFWPSGFLWARYVAPVTPIFAVFAAMGLQRLWTWARPHLPALDRAVPALVGALLLANLYGNVTLGVLDRDYSPEWAEFIDIADWIKTHTDPNDLVLSKFPAHLFILTGRKGDFLFRGQSIRKRIITSFAQALQHFDETGAKYLVHGRNRGGSKALDTELFSRLEQPGSGWRIAYVGRFGAIYARNKTPLSPPTLQEASRARSE